jgi:hypothetical protein
MTELEKIHFNGIGLPYLSNGSIVQADAGAVESPYPVGERYVWPYADDVHPMETHQPLQSTEDFILKGIDGLNFLNASRDPTGTLERRLGGHAIWEVAFGHLCGSALHWCCSRTALVAKRLVSSLRS